MIKKIKFFKYLLKQQETYLSNQNLPKHKKIDKSLGSQKGQVEFLINNFFNYEKNGLKKNGYFVDLACADGIKYNNTYFLEKYLNWTGILIEPNPKFKDSIEKYRISNYVNYCIGQNNTDIVDFRIDNKMLGGIVGESFDNNTRNRNKELASYETITLQTRTLESVLHEFNAPKIIDYLSLDVEGAEEFILKNFNFKKYKFKFLTIERPSADLDIKLDSEDYAQVHHSGMDVFYSHKEFLDEINFNPKLLFKITPQK